MVFSKHLSSNLEPSPPIYNKRTSCHLCFSNMGECKRERERERMVGGWKWKTTHIDDGTVLTLERERENPKTRAFAESIKYNNIISFAGGNLDQSVHVSCCQKEDKPPLFSHYAAAFPIHSWERFSICIRTLVEVQPVQFSLLGAVSLTLNWGFNSIFLQKFYRLAARAFSNSSWWEVHGFSRTLNYFIAQLMLLARIPVIFLPSFNLINSTTFWFEG